MSRQRLQIQVPPKLDNVVRARIETALAAARIATVLESPPSSRLWREFQAVCRNAHAHCYPELPNITCMNSSANGGPISG